jgi:hypothetical protein
LFSPGGKKRKRNGQGAFFPGWDMPCWLCHVVLFQLLGAIKSCFKGQSLNFIVHLMSWRVIILSESNQNYPSIALMSQGGFWSYGD